jgi:hypothetical protein
MHCLTITHSLLSNTTHSMQHRELAAKQCLWDAVTASAAHAGSAFADVALYEIRGVSNAMYGKAAKKERSNPYSYGGSAHSKMAREDDGDHSDGDRKNRGAKTRCHNCKGKRDENTPGWVDHSTNECTFKFTMHCEFCLKAGVTRGKDTQHKHASCLKNPKNKKE